MVSYHVNIFFQYHQTLKKVSSHHLLCTQASYALHSHTAVIALARLHSITVLSANAVQCSCTDVEFGVVASKHLTSLLVPWVYILSTISHF